MKKKKNFYFNFLSLNFHFKKLFFFYLIKKKNFEFISIKIIVDY